MLGPRFTFPLTLAIIGLAVWTGRSERVQTPLNESEVHREGLSDPASETPLPAPSGNRTSLESSIAAQTVIELDGRVEEGAPVVVLAELCANELALLTGRVEGSTVTLGARATPVLLCCEGTTWAPTYVGDDQTFRCKLDAAGSVRLRLAGEALAPLRCRLAHVEPMLEPAASFCPSTGEAIRALLLAEDFEAGQVARLPSDAAVPDLRFRETLRRIQPLPEAVDLDGREVFWPSVPTEVRLCLDYEDPAHFDIVPKGESVSFHVTPAGGVSFDEEHFHQSSLSAAFRLARGESKEFTTRYLAGSRIIGAPSFDPSALTAHVILTRHQTVDPSGDGPKQIRSSKVLGYRDLKANGTFVFDDLSLGEYTVELSEQLELNRHRTRKEVVSVRAPGDYPVAFERMGPCSLTVQVDPDRLLDESGCRLDPSSLVRLRLRYYGDPSGPSVTSFLLWTPAAGPLQVEGLLDGFFKVAAEGFEIRLLDCPDQSPKVSRLQARVDLDGSATLIWKL